MNTRYAAALVLAGGLLTPVGATWAAGPVAPVQSAQSELIQDAYVSLSLPKGVTLQLPSNWQALSKNSRTTLQAAVQAMQPDATGKLGYAANLYDETSHVIGIVNLRYHSDETITQVDVRNATAQDLKEYGDSLRESLEKSGALGNARIVSWSGTRHEIIDAKPSLITEYRRSSPSTRTTFNVRIVQIFRGSDTFSLTISYREDYVVLLKPITTRVIKTLRIQ